VAIYYNEKWETWRACSTIFHSNPFCLLHPHNPIFITPLNHTKRKHRYISIYNISVVTVMDTLSWCDWEPSSVRAIVIEDVSGPHPLKLMALVQVEFSQIWLVPPILLTLTAAAPFRVLHCSHWHRAFTSIDFKVLEGGKEGSVAPIRLHTTTLGGPIVSIPYRTVHTHRLVLRIRNSLVLHVCVHSYWRFIHQKPDHVKNMYKF